MTPPDFEVVPDPSFHRSSYGFAEMFLVGGASIGVVVRGQLQDRPGTDGWYQVGAPNQQSIVCYRFRDAVDLAKRWAARLLPKGDSSGTS